MGKALLGNLAFIAFTCLMLLPVSFFQLAPIHAAAYGVSKLQFAFALTGLIGAISTFLLCSFTAHKYAYAKMATRKYQTILEEGLLEEEPLAAYELGTQSKNWLPYLKNCVKERVTWKEPLLFRAGIESEGEVENGIKQSKSRQECA